MTGLWARVGFKGQDELVTLALDSSTISASRIQATLFDNRVASIAGSVAHFFRRAGSIIIGMVALFNRNIQRTE
jgi:hypothetical protein